MSVLARPLRAFRRPPDLAVDAALALAVLLAQLAPFTTMHGPWSAALYAPVLGSSLPLLLRRRLPVTAMVAVLVSVPLYDLVGGGPSQPIWYGWLVAVYTVADRSPHRDRLLALAVTAASTLLVVRPGSVDTAVRGAAIWLAAYALGRAAALRRQRAADLEERAVRLERERRLEAERAAERERTRIARDMHDVLAHAVSLMVVQAESGPLVVRSDPDRAEAAFDAIAASGRDAMGQLRRMLGLLKDDDGPRDAQPSLARLPELAGRVRETGLPVSLSVDGVPLPEPPSAPAPAGAAARLATLRPDVDAAAYRIVQEALTNAVKHAGADRVDVALAWEGDVLRVTVTDDGRGPGRAGGGGRGLVGVRERAAACGGDASFGPAPGGRGARVEARLPAGADT
ncbi:MULTISPECIES: sensor histidine kinase [Actinomadura]|uniref:sensor histidine kinase n=1 Tax=Actinomadura TaxID=1988 RepID=UPI0004090F6F|nr:MULTISPECIES: histidine kinase [Actinomadura]RSN51457.1 sensor histidine kinase [Actinomadura sp. WAC 06369]